MKWSTRDTCESSGHHKLNQKISANNLTRIQSTDSYRTSQQNRTLSKQSNAMTDSAAPKVKAVKPKGDKKPTTQALIREAILALKVNCLHFHAFKSLRKILHCAALSCKPFVRGWLLNLVPSNLQERTGSSPAAIKKYLGTKGPVDSSRLNRELKKLVAKGYLVKVRR